MTVLAAVAFLGLTLVNRAVGRSMLYPPVVFTATWAGCLMWLSLLKDRFFPMSSETLAVFLLGGVALSLGGLVAVLLRRERGPAVVPASRSPEVVDRLITLGLWLCLLAFPLNVIRVKELAASQGATDPFSLYFWGSVRRASVIEAEENRLGALALTDNFILLAGFLALAAIALDLAQKRLRARTVGLVVLALIYNLMTAGRAGGMILVLGMAAIAWLAKRAISWKVVAACLASGITVFAPAAIVLGKGGNPFATAQENVTGMWESFELYGLGGLVAFDHTIRQPDDIPPAWSVTWSFVRVANKLGAGLDLPSSHAEWSQVSGREWTNVYTMYFAYFPRLGWGGVAVFTFVVGAAMGWLFLSAQGGDPRARLLYAAAVGGLVLSSFAEYFFMNVNILTKAGLFTMVLYGFPSLRPHAHMVAQAAPADPRATGPGDDTRGV